MRKAKTYLLTIPVSDRQAARTLGGSSAWEVLEELREAGLDGLTVQEIRKRLDPPPSTSTIYSVLQRLEAGNWVEPRRRRKKIGRPDAKRQAEAIRTGRMRQIYVEKIPWGDTEFEVEFKEILDGAIENMLEKHTVVDSFIDLLDKILANLERRENFKEFIPSSDLCPRCKASHESEEFVWALGIGLIRALLSKRFHNKLGPVLEKHGVKGYMPA